MPWRMAAAASPAATRAAVIAWRLSLGWLAGRWFTLVGTSTGESVRRSIVPFAMAEGTLYVVAPPGAPWLGDVARRPIAQAQTHPGPLAVRARPLHRDEEPRVAELFRRVAPDLAATDRRRWLALQPTGDRPPDPVVSDLMWVWGVAAAAMAVRFLSGSPRGCQPSPARRRSAIAR